MRPLCVWREGCGAFTTDLRQIGDRHRRDCAAIFDHPRKAVRRILGIDRHVSRSRFKNSQDRGIGVNRSRQQHGDGCPAPCAPAAQMAGCPISARLQLTVSD